MLVLPTVILCSTIMRMGRSKIDYHCKIRHPRVAYYNIVVNRIDSFGDINKVRRTAIGDSTTKYYLAYIKVAFHHYLSPFFA
jgi:hypothetical protein